MVIAYEYKQGLYLNITNRCTNRCRFCLREKVDGLGDYSLWLEYEPELMEIIEAIDKKVQGEVKEIVFCGYGEPLIRIDAVVAITQYIKEKYALPIRINTNGMANLIHKRNILPELTGLVDIISISLNAENASKYEDLCQPEFEGAKAYKAILDFITEAKKYIPKVIATVVAGTGADIMGCRALTQQLGIEFRVRELF